LDEVLQRDAAESLILGGGDATAWPHLDTLLSRNAARASPQQLWVEAPAAAFTAARLAALVRGGVHGVRIQIEAATPKWCAALGVGNGERAIAEAERLGLQVRILLCVRPKTFRSLFGLAKRLAPRAVEVELVRQNWGERPIPIYPETLERALREVRNVKFSATRMSDRGYLPPCALPQIWDSVPTVWRGVFRQGGAPNTAVAACGTCALSTRCSFADVGALPEPSTVRPIQGDPEPWSRRGGTEEPVPARIVAKRPTREVICTTPWTTMEIVDPNGAVTQCCADWTVGVRGNITASSLAEVWNGPGYRTARRVMSGEDLAPLCKTICARLYDRKFTESALRIQNGSKPFVDNQLLLAEEIADRKEVIKAKPLNLFICPSTYCNYDCIMCLYGRTPRRDLPDSIWDELPEYLPTLKSLTLLGGEPLANPHTMDLLRGFDVERYPDAAIDIVTNGALLTEKTLSYLQRCTFGSLMISLNAGTPETYERVQRGLALATVLENIDALLRFRATHHRWFGLALSFVAQPAAIDTIIDFAEIARVRNLPIRVMALNPDQVPELDFYTDPDQVAHVITRLDELIAYCRRVREDWLAEALSARDAVRLEAARRRGRAAHGTAVPAGT
jgi:pyruvate-formate lyase-activating enzyme